jgi:hypothetical protein
MVPVEAVLEVAAPKETETVGYRDELPHASPLAYQCGDFAQLVPRIINVEGGTEGVITQLARVTPNKARLEGSLKGLHP